MTDANRPPRPKLRLGALAAALTATLALLCCTGGTGAFFLTELGGEAAEQLTRPAWNARATSRSRSPATCPGCPATATTSSATPP